MKLSVGIVGLPNVGKSTLFNALLKKQVALAANYPFATIEPNVGVVEVPDERLEALANVIARSDTTKQSPPIVPAAIEFYDIAGLVAGASTGEGLGNKFLSHIREVAAIIHVVRLFEDENVIHVTDKVDAKHDIETIEQELILADLQTLEKQDRPNKKLEKEDVVFYDTIDLLRKRLDKGTPAREIDLTNAQQEAIKPLNLLTIKPVIYVYNVSEGQLTDKTTIEEKINVILASEARPESRSKLDPGQARMTSLYLSAKLESEIVELSPVDQKEYLKQYGLEESGLNRMIKKAYQTLGLMSFLTAGEKEVRAWTIKRDTKAPQAAAAIHTDFEKHFIKAEVVPFQTFVDLGGWVKCRDTGKVTLAGRDYVLQDGDVVDFKVGV